MRRAWAGVLALGFAASAFAQTAQVPAAPPAGSAQGAAPGGADSNAGAGTQAQKAAGPSRASNRKPTDIRLRDGGVKMPKCANESREGLDCK